MMNARPRLIRIVFGLLCAVALQACSKGRTPEDVIKEAVLQAASAAGEKDVKGVMRFVSRSFKNDEGLDYNAVKALLLSELFRSEKTRVFVTSVNVEVKGDTAVAVVLAVLARGKDVKELKDVLPEDASAKRFSIVFRREEGDSGGDAPWKAVSAEWEGVVPPLT